MLYLYLSLDQATTSCNLRKALEECGALGKLIKKGTIDEPEEPDRSSVSMADGLEKAEYIEDVKAYAVY
jgi:hypothetical protein